VRLADDEVHVWTVGLGSADRRSRRQESHDAMRRILSAYLGGRPPLLDADCRGKPRLIGDQLRFNLSHSGDLALVAVTRACEVGVDVEHEAPGRDFAALARRALEAECAEAVCATPTAQRAERFYTAWARREAAAKCFGTGLTGGPPPRPPSIHNLDIDEGYAAAAALDAGAALPLRRFRIDRTLPTEPFAQPPFSLTMGQL
jgi:4'-phosphopantetheinyl transferase